MKKILMLFLSLVVVLSCIVPVYAAETVLSFPDIPDLTADDPLEGSLDIYVFKRIYKVLDKYYALVWSSFNNNPGVKIYPTDGGASVLGSLSFSSGVRCVDLYALEGDLWMPLYRTPELSDSVSMTIKSVSGLSFDTTLKLAWNSGYDNSTLLVYDTYDGVITNLGNKASKTINPSDHYEVEFGSSSTGDSGMTEGDMGFFERLFQDIKNHFTELFKPILDYFAEKKEQQTQKDSIWKSLGESFTTLMDAVADVTINPIRDFFDSLSFGAIAIWQEFFTIPIIREFTYAVVLVSLFGGLLTLLITF